ncbi:cupin domain-containing protein [Ramlibacter sp. AW1]|uniref:Cupin domain-containing protein n=1 Tax=Ramlibacter aurantiacus TaxID=2801330 RepID=A0A936ZRR3_9BURK|nr:cupin domain-containing protein [Ramlibacter aurantiacus]MBL0422425.1 cupin domain-containing protein [Ramlibacter aurantiacus]
MNAAADEQPRPEDFESPEQQGTQAKVFRYVKPELDRVKGVVVLARSDIMLAAVQLVKKGGENNLHSHSAMDGLWFVLKGRVRFYGEKDVLLGEFGPHEGVFIPRGVSYWFESSSDEVLEILQVESFVKGAAGKRIDHEPKKLAGKDFVVFKA